MRDDVNSLQSTPALQRTGDLPQRGFIIVEQDRLDIGSDALEQTFKIVDAWIDKGDFGLDVALAVPELLPSAWG